MGLLGSALGNALGAAGNAVSELSSKYIDEELAKNRAKFLSDLQFEQNKRLDEYNTGEERQGRLRKNATDAATAAHKTNRDLALDDAGDTELHDAKSGAETRRLEAERVAKNNRTIADANDTGLIGAAKQTAKVNAEIARQGTIDASNDKAFLSAKTALDASDPLKAAQISAQQAHAALYSAQAEATRSGNKLPQASVLQYQELSKQRTELMKEVKEGLASGELQEPPKKGEKQGQDGWFGPNDKDKSREKAQANYSAKMLEIRTMEAQMKGLLGSDGAGGASGSPGASGKAGGLGAAVSFGGGDDAATEGRTAEAVAHAARAGDRDYDLQIGSKTTHSVRDGKPVQAKVAPAEQKPAGSAKPDPQLTDEQRRIRQAMAERAAKNRDGDRNIFSDGSILERLRRSWNEPEPVRPLLERPLLSLD